MVDVSPIRRAGLQAGDLVRILRLVSQMLLREPRAFPHFLWTVQDCMAASPRTLRWVGMQGAFYLHLAPFTRFVTQLLDRQIGMIDSGTWQAPEAVESRAGGRKGPHGPVEAPRLESAGMRAAAALTAARPG
jgi:hypothetical protein